MRLHVRTTDPIDQPPSEPMAVWQYAERYLGDGTRTYSAYAADIDIDDTFHPQRGAASFAVPTFRIPTALGAFVQPRHRSALVALYRTEEAFLLPVHPNALDATGLVLRDVLLSCERGPDLRVVPSANARTVFVTAIDGAPVAPHFVKLHYPRRLSRFTRRLRKPVIEAQLWVSDELLDAGVPLLPEVGGGFLGDSDDAWGFLIRDTVAVGAPHLPLTVPLFALYGRDLRRPSDPTLIEQLVDVSGEDAATFIADRVVVPAVRLWARAVTRTGVAVEPHGQNTLLSFEPDGSRTALLYRDCGVYVDEGIRVRQHLHGLPPVNVIGRDVREDTGHVLSLGYDSFLWHHALSYLTRLAQDRFGIPPQRFHDAARAAAADAAVELPPTRYYYQHDLSERTATKLVDTGEVPHWR